MDQKETTRNIRSDTDLGFRWVLGDFVPDRRRKCRHRREGSRRGAKSSRACSREFGGRWSSIMEEIDRRRWGEREGGERKRRKEEERLVLGFCCGTFSLDFSQSGNRAPRAGFFYSLFNYWYLLINPPKSQIWRFAINSVNRFIDLM